MRKTFGKFGVRIVFTLAMTLGFAASAAAQGQLGAGVSFLRDEGETAKGFTVDYAGTISRGASVDVSWVGDLGWHNAEGGSNLSLLGGVRVGTADAPVGVFGQVLVGLIKFSPDGDVSDLCDELDLDCGSTDLAFAPGIGVNIPVSPRVNVRGQVDFFVIRAEGETFSAQRFWFGVALPVGQ